MATVHTQQLRAFPVAIAGRPTRVRKGIALRCWCRGSAAGTRAFKPRHVAACMPAQLGWFHAEQRLLSHRTPNQTAAHGHTYRPTTRIMRGVVCSQHLSRCAQAPTRTSSGTRHTVNCPTRHRPPRRAPRRALVMRQQFQSSPPCSLRSSPTSGT